ncbi:hypothetical protein [Methylobacterium gregans]|uniref:Uncharacterized protein n=1 Tax=Methylobacterium gregans TaxID=374424 RepID=A0AA37HPS2_9HYPH|nr:hypothetical protein [Methylobacterium gregans]MDQ0522428.1 hypothetical protein [Methylobacterium gregans]GJD79568.1 hypothetical protein NBEOAGPD_2797 [Methylobacterium gregans]GLS55174.1 hypothetical protein GCM10007886_33580 [Methylobacterium gregans]
MRQENEVITLALQRAWEQGRNGTALAPDAASAVVEALRDAGFEIVPTPDDEPLPEPDEIYLSVGYGQTPLPYMPEGSAARIGEARRTGDWSDVTDADWKAWVNVLRDSVPLEPGNVIVLPPGTRVGVTPEEFLAAIHGEDGLEIRDLSGLSWLRDLLRSARNPGAIQALQGDNDDEGAVYDMLRAVEDMYRRLAPLTGQRPDIFDSENPENRGEAA